MKKVALHQSIVNRLCSPNLLSLIIAFTCSLGPCRADETLPWLQTKGKKIVTKKGEKLLLRGINLGGWLAEEMWMLPFITIPPKDSGYSQIEDHVSLWNTLQTRFGKEKMQEIRSAFRAAYITNRDLDRIKEAGFNSIRVPFLYDLIEEDDGLFFWLDKVVGAAKARGLYVILDMHGTPGRQSDENHTGQKSQGTLFSDPLMVKKCAKIWAKIAEHYKSHPEVAGYDLMNEPKGAKTNSQLYKVYHKIYKAIRKVDKRHIIFIEDGYKGLTHMAHPKKYGWKNVVFSTHAYNFAAKSDDELQTYLKSLLTKLNAEQKKRNIPYYLGEFNVTPNGTKSALQTYVESFHKENLSYSLWSYKIAHRGHSHNLWALYYSTRHLPEINPFKDSARDILKKIEYLNTDQFSENRNIREVMTKIAAFDTKTLYEN